MVASLRNHYNANVSKQTYEAMLAQVHQDWPGALDFRIAETPVFVPNDLKEKLVSACESFIDVIVKPDFRERTQAAIPAAQFVPNENAHSSFLAIDFAVCKDANGTLTPQLIELQGFPSVFGFQSYLTETFRQQYTIDACLSNYFGCTNQAKYIEALRQTIVADEKPENVILLEIFPEKQKTRIDFAVTEAFLGVKAVCYTKILKEGRQLFYMNDGQKTKINRIYNRLIFDDLNNFPDLQTQFQFTDDVDVTWVAHPNWFFRISKYILPFLQGQYVPETRFLSEYAGVFPTDLANYVLKPLFSFAGGGVKIDVQLSDLAEITDPQNWILQRKVTYEPVIASPEGLVKCEIRMLYVWPDQAARPRLLTSLSRLSRGAMIGVNFNKDFDWVGASTCFYEK